MAPGLYVALILAILSTAISQSVHAATDSSAEQVGAEKRDFSALRPSQLVERDDRLVRRAHGDNDAEPSRVRAHPEGSREPSPPSQRQRTDSPDHRAAQDIPARPTPQGNLVEGGERLALVRKVSKPSFPQRARDEIVLRTMVGKRIDLYMAMSRPSNSVQATVPLIMKEKKEKFDRDWKPDQKTQQSIDTVKQAARREGCDALKHALYEQQLFPAHADARDMRDISTICAGIHLGVQKGLGPRPHSYPMDQLHSQTQDPLHFTGLSQEVRLASRRTGGLSGEKPIEEYDEPIDVFVRGIFRDVSWQQKEAASRANTVRRIRKALENYAWSTINGLRAGDGKHLGVMFHELRDRAGDPRRFPWLGWRHAIAHNGWLVAVDVAIALFPRQCRVMGYRRENVKRWGIPLPPPMVLPEYLIGRRDARMQAAVNEHEHDVAQLEHLRPRPAPLRVPQSDMTFPHGIPRADLLAGRPRQQLERTNSA